MSFSADQHSILEALLSQQDGWTLSTESDAAKLFSRPLKDFLPASSKGSGLDAVKLVAHVPYPADELHAITRDIDIRREVSPLVSHVELLEEHEHGDVVYQRVTPPIPLMSVRTMLIERKFTVHKRTLEHEASPVNAYHWFMKSLDTHAKLPKGESSSVRCTIHVQAMRIEPHPTLPKNTILTVVNQYVDSTTLFILITLITCVFQLELCLFLKFCLILQILLG